jgi:hypothetical protein
MFTRTVTDLEDGLIQAALDSLRAALPARLADLDPERVILDPEDPDYETLGENALNGSGLLLTPVVGLAFPTPQLCTATLTINCEVDWKQHQAATGPLALSPRDWAQWALAACLTGISLEVITLSAAGIDDGGTTESTDSWHARLTGTTILTLT